MSDIQEPVNFKASANISPYVASVAEVSANVARSSKRKMNNLARNAIIIAVVFHLVLGVAAAFIVALRTFKKPAVSFKAPPPIRPAMEPRKLEQRVRVQDLQKRSSRPKLNQRLAANRVSDITLPKLPKKPKKVEKKIKTKYSLVASGFGDGIGGGFGTGAGGGAGGNITFFGLKSIGKRVAYIIDFSASMGGARDKKMREELTKSIDGLPMGSDVFMCFFSGPYWEAGEDIKKLHGDWRQGKEGWGLKKGNVGKPKWQKVTPRLKDDLKDDVKYTPLSFGTDWRGPFEWVFDLNPKPEIIFFMTDGSPQVKNEEKVLALARKANKGKTTAINCISIGDARAEKYMRQMSEESGKGQFKVVNVAGGGGKGGGKGGGGNKKKKK